MATQREKEAADYLEKHRIMELLENLSGLLFFYRPGSRSPAFTPKHPSWLEHVTNTVLVTVTRSYLAFLLF